MKEEVVKLVGDKLKEFNVYISDAYLTKNGKDTYFCVEVDSFDKDDIVDIDRVVGVTKIVDPIIEKADLVEESYILDVYVKSKGDE